MVVTWRPPTLKFSAFCAGLFVRLLSFLRRLFTDPLDVPKLSGVRWWAAAVHQPLERIDMSLGHAQPPVVVTNHGVDAPVPCVLQLLKDRAIEWLTHAEHAPFARMDDRAVAGEELQ